MILRPGRASRASRRAARSRGVAWPRLARPTRRGRSGSSFRAARRLSRSRGSPTSSSTAWWRASMASRERRGKESHCLSRRPPMEVAVWSTACSKEPLRPPPAMERNSSRLRWAAASRTRWLATRYRLSGSMCPGRVCWVLKTADQARAAATRAESAASSSPSTGRRPSRSWRAWAGVGGRPVCRLRGREAPAGPRSARPGWAPWLSAKTSSAGSRRASSSARAGPGRRVVARNSPLARSRQARPSSSRPR